MFEGVPAFWIFNGYEETSKRQLKLFQERVMEHAKLNQIQWENRFLCISQICDRLQELLKTEGGNLYPASAKEPSESFQVLFQLLVYALGDQGLLYNPYGAWNQEPNQDCWEASEKSYWQLVAAMRDRNFAYRSLQKMRKDIKAHNKQENNYQPDSKLGELADKDEELKWIEDAHRKYFQEVDNQKLQNALSQIKEDYLCMQCTPLYLFFALYVSKTGSYDKQCFFADLRQSRSKFRPPQKPAHIVKACEYWDHYQQCEKFCQGNINLYLSRPIPDPYFLIGELLDAGDTQISKQQYVAIADYALKYLAGTKVLPPPNAANITINGVSLTDIVTALINIFRASEFQFEGDSKISPRALKRSLCTIWNSGVIEASDIVIDDDDESTVPTSRPLTAGSLTDEGSDALKQAILRKYGIDTYDFSREAFWLVTGYTPPSEFVPEIGARDLYSVCFRDLHSIWNGFFQLIKSESPHMASRNFSEIRDEELHECNLMELRLGYSPELHGDILKAQSYLASKWNKEYMDKFLQCLYCVGSKYNPVLEDEVKGVGRIYFCDFKKDEAVEQLKQFADKLYESIKDKKSAFKSFTYARELMDSFLLDECFVLAGSYLYKQVFDTLPMVSDLLWPMTGSSI